VAIEILRAIEAMTRRPIRDSFDLIAGTSSGGILAIALGLKGASLDDCETIVRDMASNLFQTRGRAETVLRPGKLLLNRGVYDSATFEKLLKHHLGSKMLIDTRAVTTEEAECPRVFAVSTLVSRSPAVPYLHSNYRLPPPAPGTKERRFQHSCHHRFWEAARATTAAPYYFSAFKTGEDIFCDGAIIMNNPALVALHESRLIWRRRPLACLLSIGTGSSDDYMYDVETPGGEGFLSLGRTVLESATETEITHRALEDLLPENKYYRFSPSLDSAQVTLDEFRGEELRKLQTATRAYLGTEVSRLRQAAGILNSVSTQELYAVRPGKL